jgi:hypothetical protein
LNESQRDIAVACELPDNLPLSGEELKLLQELLPELLKDMQGMIPDKE